MNNVSDVPYYSIPHSTEVKGTSRQEKLLYDLEKWNKKLELQQCNYAWINARLYQIDPHLVGKKRLGSKSWCLNRICHFAEVASLQKQQRQILHSIHQIMNQCLALESELEGDFSQIKEPRLELLINFFEKMPIFQNYPHLKAILLSQTTLPEKMQVKQVGEDKLEITFPERVHLKLDMDVELPEEECQRLDPEHPLIGSGQKISIHHLNQFGSIEKSWVETIGNRKPAFGPKLVIQRQENSILFLEGVSKLRKIELQPDRIGFQILWFNTTFDWALEDFLSLLLRFKEVSSNS